MSNLICITTRPWSRVKLAELGECDELVRPVINPAKVTVTERGLYLFTRGDRLMRPDGLVGDRCARNARAVEVADYGY